MLAVVLDVPLLALMWPLTESKPVSVAPGVQAAPWRAMEWTVGNDLLPGVPTDPEVWSSATQFIRLVIWLLNAAETALSRDRDRFPKDKYREILQELAKVLHEADEIGLATEGMIPDEVRQDLDREMQQAPMRRRAIVQPRVSEPS